MSIFKIVKTSPSETQLINLLMVKRIEKKGNGSTLHFEQNDKLDIDDSYEEMELFIRTRQSNKTPIFQGS